MAHTLAASNVYPNDNTTTNSGSPVNFAVTIASNATGLALGLITVGANARAGTAPNINGTDFTQANTAQKAASSPETVSEMWYLESPPTGAVTITIPNTNTNGIKSFLAQFSAGANNTSVFDVANGANATSTNPTVSLTTTANGAAIAMVCGDGLSNCITGFTNQSGTNLYKCDLGAYGGGFQYVLQANLGAITVNYTANSDDWGAVAVAFKPNPTTNGAISQTLGSVTTTFTGEVRTPINGEISQTLGAITQSIEGVVTTPDNGVVSQTLGEITATITGTVEPYFKLYASGNIPAGGSTATTAQLTAPANKTTGDFQAGNISDDTNPLPAIDLTANKYTELEWSIRATTGTSNGQVFTFRVTSNGTELDTYSANATWTIGDTNAAVSQTLGGLTASIAGTAETHGTVAQTLASVTITDTGTVAVQAGVQQTLAGAGLSAAATVSVSGAVVQTLGAITPTVTGTLTVPRYGEVTQTLGAIVPTFTGEVTAAPFGGAVSQTLGEITPTITGTVALAGSLAQTLGVMGRNVTGAVAVTGAVNHTLGNANLTCDGLVGSPGGLEAFILWPSSYIAANATTNTTGQLTAPTGKTVNGYFQAGKISDDTNPLPAIDLIVNTYTELEWAIRSTALSVNTANYSFRVTANGTAVNTYAVTPTWKMLNPINGTVNQTLGSATLYFTTEGAEPGTGRVEQTLGAITPTFAATVGYPATVSITLGSLSAPVLRLTATITGGDAPTFWNVYFGRSPSSYSDIVPVPYTSSTQDITLRDIAPGSGEWYVMAKLANLGGESSSSNELFVVVPTFTGTVASVFAIAVNQTLAPIQRAVAGRVGIEADITQTLGDVGTAITEAVGITGSVAQTLGPIVPTVTATRILEGGAWVDVLLSEVQRSISGTVAITGQVEQTLASIIAGTGVVGGVGRARKHNVLLDGSDEPWRL